MFKTMPSYIKFADVNDEKYPFGKYIQWPQYWNGKYVWFGDEIVTQHGYEHGYSNTVHSIDIMPVTNEDGVFMGCDALIRFEDADINPDDYMLVCMWEGEKVLHNYGTGE